MGMSTAGVWQRASEQRGQTWCPACPSSWGCQSVPEPGRTGATGGCQDTRAEHSLASLQFCFGDQLWELESCCEDRKRGMIILANTNCTGRGKGRISPQLIRPLGFKQQPQHHL